MAADSILQLKEPLFIAHRGAAQKNVGLNARVLDFLAADDFIDIHTQKPVAFVLHPKPEGPDITIGAANRYDIYRTNIWLHSFPSVLLSVIIIVHSFVNSKWNFLVAYRSPL